MAKWQNGKMENGKMAKWKMLEPEMNPENVAVCNQ